MDLAALRREYRNTGIDIGDLAADPIEQFVAWFDERTLVDEVDANAVVLATADPTTGRPSVRNVLLKHVHDGQFVWFTNRVSRKGREIESNPQGALLFSWTILARQVIVEGAITPIDDTESDAYFTSRPRGAQIGAWASQQSRPIASRAELEHAVDEVAERFGDGPIPRPTFWGGYALTPDRFEFWQGRENRLHDRIEYLPAGTTWGKRRLNP